MQSRFRRPALFRQSELEGQAGTQVPSLIGPIEPVFLNRYQPDIARIAKSQRGENLIPFGAPHVKTLQAKGTYRPYQVHMTDWGGTIAVANTPQLLIPSNENRLRWIIGNTTGVIVFYSYRNSNSFIPIPVNGTAQDNSNTVSVDDIFIMCPVVGKTIDAFEGMAAQEANK